MGDEDLTSFGAQITDLCLQKLDLFAGAASSDLQQSVDDGVEINVVLVRHCFCPLVEEGDGGVCCGFRSERVWRDYLLPRFEFAVTRTVIHFSIWGACGISKRLSGWGGANSDGRVEEDLNTFRSSWNTYNEVRSASMELSAKSRVSLDPAKIVFRLCGRGSRVSRKTIYRGHLLSMAT